jgi:prephenate dehydratase
MEGDQPTPDRPAPVTDGRVGFLGPEGTFTEEALLTNLQDDGLTPFPYPSIRDVMSAVRGGEAALGLVPIENSIEGSVALTLDSLAWEFDDLVITREVVHPIRHQLIARRPRELTSVTKVISHPHAYAQCRAFLNEHLPGVEHEAANSTAEAVRMVSRVDRPWVAIGTRLAADMYEGVVLRDDIEDFTDNATRFVFVSRTPAPQELDTPYKTSLVCGIDQDEPGSLLLILSEFAYRHVNLTKVESRPSKQALGHYIFFIDTEGRAQDAPLAQAVKCLACKLPWLRVLGSYPTR